jgi:hypothetical protein
MTEDDSRALIRRLWEAVGKEDIHDEVYTEDAVLEFPQSGERFEGLKNFHEWRSQYPGRVRLDLGEVRGAGDLWVAEGTITYDDEPPEPTVEILELRGDRIARETIYLAERWEAPDWRAPWRSAP